MSKQRDIIKVFIDDEKKPIAEVEAPSKILFDTTKLVDGKHTLKLVARSSSDKEGIKLIPFEVRNGPDISVIGLQADDVVSEQLPITINAYGSERKDIFLITGSENPKGIPSWIWVVLLLFIGWAIHYLYLYWTSENYTSFF